MQRPDNRPGPDMSEPVGEISSAQTRELIDSLEHPKWRELLQLQLEPDEKLRYRNHTTLRTALEASEVAGIMESELAPTLRDCDRLLELGMLGNFPGTDSWNHAGAAILTWFWKLRHASFAATIERHYQFASEQMRGSALVIACCQEGPEALDPLVRIIEQYDLPSATQPRFFWELNRRHVANARRLLPALLMKAKGGFLLGEVMNFINTALDQGQLAAADLMPAAQFAELEADRLLQQAEALQQATGTSWRCAEDYAAVRVALGVHLDLFGIIPGDFSAILRRTLALQDPLLVFFAVQSLVQKQIEPPAAALQLCASSHETRATLYTQLQRRNRLDLFPQAFATFEAFAASSMTQWLMYPAELGYEPKQLVLVAKVTGATDEDKQAVMCLWKCSPEEGADFACVSGPYPVDADIGPLWGDDTFSNFTDWDQATPEQHLEHILGTLQNWRVAWCSEHSNAEMCNTAVTPSDTKPLSSCADDAAS
jgi:hypothetical protein